MTDPRFSSQKPVESEEMIRETDCLRQGKFVMGLEIDGLLQAVNDDILEAFKNRFKIGPKDLHLYTEEQQAIILLTQNDAKNAKIVNDVLQPPDDIRLNIAQNFLDHLCVEKNLKNFCKADGYSESETMKLLEDGRLDQIHKQIGDQMLASYRQFVELSYVARIYKNPDIGVDEMKILLKQDVQGFQKKFEEYKKLAHEYFEAGKDHIPGAHEPLELHIVPAKAEEKPIETRLQKEQNKLFDELLEKGTRADTQVSIGPGYIAGTPQVSKSRDIG